VSAYTPLHVVSINPEGADLLTAILFAAVVFLLAVIVVRVGVRFGLNPKGASFGVAAALLILTTMGLYLYQFPGTHFGIALTAGLVGFLVYRLRAMKLIEVAITWGAFALLIGPVVTATLRTSSEGKPAQIEISDESHSVEPGGDVVVIVADGYASEAVLSEYYGFDNGDFVDSLTALGMSIGDIQANYSLTTVSVPSALQMEYVAPGGSLLTSSDNENLLKILGGENIFARSLRSSGYRNVFIESGWLGTQCGPSVDVCVRPPWPGETFFDIGFRTILRDLPGFVTGTQFNRGALSAMDWLQEELPEYLSNDIPEYIYAHILAPHPPLFFQSDCRVDRKPGYGGFAITHPEESGASNPERRDAYIRQVQCMNSVAKDVAAKAIDASATLVFFGDHGPDGQEQLYSPGNEWTASQIQERFGTFAAVFVPGCDTSDRPTSLVDLLPQVIACLGGEARPPRQPESYAVRRQPEGSRVIKVDYQGS
jgi:hypothetical protein